MSSQTEDDRLANNARALGKIAVYPWQSYPGMTLRHLLAAMAMQGILSRGTPGMAHERAATAIEHADALLKGLARE